MPHEVKAPIPDRYCKIKNRIVFGNAAEGGEMGFRCCGASSEQLNPKGSEKP